MTTPLAALLLVLQGLLAPGPGGQVPAAPPARPARLSGGITGALTGSLLDTVPGDDPRDLGTVALQLPPGVQLAVEPGLFPGTYSVTIADTGTGFAETFFVQTPPVFTTKPRPLLVFFHAFAKKGDDVSQNTSFEFECLARNWFLVAPLGASKKHFSSLESQINTEIVLAFLQAAFGRRIDSRRIYGVGFSMGGGACLNFAARHLDPRRPMFAALANHTGGVALTDTWVKDAGARPILEFWFGGTPTQQPFAYLRSSLLSFDAQKLVDRTSDLARNLTHVPVQSYRVKADPLQYLVAQTEILHQHLLSLGASSELFALSGFEHSWKTLDEHAVCDFLEKRVLRIPPHAETLADRDDVYFHFAIEQDAPGAFTPFAWTVDGAANRVDVLETANLARVTLDVASAGLSSATGLSFGTQPRDGLADELRVASFQALPSAVLRDGTPAQLGSEWDYDAASGIVALHESDSAFHLWQILP